MYFEFYITTRKNFFFHGINVFLKIFTIHIIENNDSQVTSEIVKCHRE